MHEAVSRWLQGFNEMGDDKILLDEAAEIAAVARNAQDIDEAAKGCRIAVEAIRRGEVEWLGGADPQLIAERLAGDMAVLTVAARMHRAVRNGSGSAE